MDIVVLGIDLGKNSCSVVGLDSTAHVLLRRRMKRESILAIARRWSGCIVAEACCGAHHLARRFAAEGHDGRRITCVPTSKAQKNDDCDAEAIAEAATRPTMRFVEIKSEAQLDVQSLHGGRERLVSERTALINQLRALLIERGIIVPQGRRKLEQMLASIIADERSGLSTRIVS